VTHHSPFDENYRFFANSHFYLGFEICAALVLLAVYSTAGQYPGRTWSLWIAAMAFLFAPFWFNPLTFEWNRVREDYMKWKTWMT
jgi:callose synthase